MGFKWREHFDVRAGHPCLRAEGEDFLEQGGPGTDTTNLAYYIYQVAFQAFDIGRASAMAVVVIIATILIATLALRVVSSLFSEEGMRGR